MTMLETNIDNTAEKMLPPTAGGVESHVAPAISGEKQALVGAAALTQVELPSEVHQLVVEDVNPDEHIRTSLKDRFVSRFIKRRMGQIEQDLNQEHRELAEKQRVRPSLLHRELNNLAQEPEAPDQFDQRLARANKMLARPQVSGATKSVTANQGPFRFDRQK